MKLDFNFNLIALDGQSSKETAAKTIANLLATKSKFLNSIKASEIARKLYNEGFVELDKEDSANLEKEILDEDKNNPAYASAQLFNFAKEQIADAIEKAKTESK